MHDLMVTPRKSWGLGSSTKRERQGGERRAKGEAGLDISLDYKSEIPIYVQLKNQLRYLIQSQQLEPERQLPTMRQLALDLGIDANTVARVYRELGEEGLIEGNRG